MCDVTSWDVCKVVEGGGGGGSGEVGVRRKPKPKGPCNRRNMVKLGVSYPEEGACRVPSYNLVQLVRFPRPALHAQPYMSSPTCPA